MMQVNLMSRASTTAMEGPMGVKAETLAKQFEAKAAEATRVLESLTDADWTKVTEAEKWSVGVTAHHVAITHETVANIITTVAAGQLVPNFTFDMLHATNAKHAQDYANCTRAETLELHTKGMATAAAVVRALGDDQLGKSGTVITGAPAMTAEQVITDVLIHHIDDHFGSIRRTVGR
jgi:uncharacterized protein (TIGR03083 family)